VVGIDGQWLTQKCFGTPGMVQPKTPLLPPTSWRGGRGTGLRPAAYAKRVAEYRLDVRRPAYRAQVLHSAVRTRSRTGARTPRYVDQDDGIGTKRPCVDGTPNVKGAALRRLAAAMLEHPASRFLRRMAEIRTTYRSRCKSLQVRKTVQHRRKHRGSWCSPQLARPVWLSANPPTASGADGLLSVSRSPTRTVRHCDARPSAEISM